MAANDFPSKRAPIYKDVPDDQWNDWRWQLSHRLNALDDFAQVLELRFPAATCSAWKSRPISPP
jgi:L-lysine 2,3-aminomutase